MNAIVPIHGSNALVRSDPQFERRLRLFKATVGKHLVGTEIDEALEYCQIYRANPLTKDIYFFVFTDQSTGERRLAPVLSIHLYRKNANASGNFRPADKPAKFTYDETLVGPDNPRGILDCEVTVYQHSHGDWHPVVGRVRWDERAPIIEGGAGGTQWEETGETYPEGHKKAGKKKYRKVPVGEVVAMLDPGKKNWRTMPETMLEKCAEAAAIRKGWPGETAGSYVEGELDRAEALELTATEILDQADQKDRVARVGIDKSLVIDWMDGSPLQAVATGQFFDRAMEFINKHTEPDKEEEAIVLQWRERNRISLQSFWALEKDAALELKKRLEAVEAKIKAVPAK